ncbi:hypothetical protein JHW43_003735 [Diplocarpon mali]|nr:hypothetical protein JHW43_003735 [Diplocarpon mali]
MFRADIVYRIGSSLVVRGSQPAQAWGGVRTPVQSQQSKDSETCPRPAPVYWRELPQSLDELSCQESTGSRAASSILRSSWSEQQCSVADRNQCTGVPFTTALPGGSLDSLPKGFA